MLNKQNWVVYGVGATILMGLWGALTGLVANNGFPATLVYCVWSLTMIPPAIFVLKRNNWYLQKDMKSILLGLTIGLLGAGGQLLLFYAVKIGPAYLIFPIISLSPVVTILLSVVFLKERTGWIGLVGIGLALIALPLFEYSPAESGDSDYGVVWFILSVLVLMAWGIQAYFMKLTNNSTEAASIFFYMMLAALLIAPLAFFMTDFNEEINYSWSGLGLTFVIQILNAIGALLLVYAFRYGKAIVVSPMTNAGAPLITSLFSMAVINIVPDKYKIIGICLAVVAAIMVAYEPEERS